MRGISAAAETQGLSTAQARNRLRHFGANTFRDQQPHSLPVQFLQRFRNPLIIILIAASLVAGFAGEVASFIIIVVMVVASVTLDFVQEYRAQRASEKLRKSVQVRAQVLRDGAVHRIRGSSVVPGDLVLLQAGSLVPADGYLVEAHDLFVNQSALTGEPFPVEKSLALEGAAASNETAFAADLLLMGSPMVGGSARMLVSRTGASTALGEISRSLNVVAPPTSFETGMRRFGLMIMRLTLLMVLFVLLVNMALHVRYGRSPVSRTRATASPVTASPVTAS